MSDRGMLKWAPFDSVVSTKSVIHKLAVEKQKTTMPTLSEEQIENITKTICNAYQLGETIQIKYYKNGYFYLKEGKINYINYQDQSIMLNNNHIYLSQIFKINN